MQGSKFLHIRLGSRLVMQFIVFFLVTQLTLSLAQETTKKLIQIGYDSPSTADIKQYCQEIETAKTPFDGLVFRVVIQNGEQTLDEGAVMTRERWDEAWLEEPLDDLQSCTLSKLTNNFIRINSTPGDLDWFSDDDWAATASNMALLAKLAKDSGSKGIFFDPETYGDPQYSYQSDKPFEEVAAKARERGAEVMKAMSAEYPDMTFISMWLFSLLRQSLLTGSDDVQAALENDKYGLFPAFVNGLLDAVPATVTLVDASETAYYFARKDEFLELGNLIKQTNSSVVAPLLAPENINKYKQQVQAGFGIYLDMYLNDLGSPYYISAKEGGTRLDRLRENVQAAVAASDEYIWIYGEQSKWWPQPYSQDWMVEETQNSVGQGRNWEEAMPGLTKALEWAKNPNMMTIDLVAEGEATGTFTNLAQNPGFESNEGSLENTALMSDWFTENAPPGWAFYQGEGSPGSQTLDTTVGHNSSSSLRVQGVNDAALIQVIPVTPGEQYFIRADVKTEGNSYPLMTARWANKSRPLAFGIIDVSLQFKPVEGDEWQQASGLITVPADMTGIVILLEAYGQASDADKVWFDNLTVYNVDDLFN
jgi:hypothetical protein